MKPELDVPINTEWQQQKISHKRAHNIIWDAFYILVIYISLGCEIKIKRNNANNMELTFLDANQ